MKKWLIMLLLVSMLVLAGCGARHERSFKDKSLDMNRIDMHEAKHMQEEQQPVIFMVEHEQPATKESAAQANLAEDSTLYVYLRDRESVPEQYYAAAGAIKLVVQYQATIPDEPWEEPTRRDRLRFILEGAQGVIVDEPLENKQQQVFYLTLAPGTYRVLDGFDAHNQRAVIYVG